MRCAKRSPRGFLRTFAARACSTPAAARGRSSVALARRGADVLGVDVSPTLVALANERAPQDLAPGRATFAVGDMLDPAHRPLRLRRRDGQPHPLRGRGHRPHRVGARSARRERRRLHCRSAHRAPHAHACGRAVPAARRPRALDRADLATRRSNVASTAPSAGQRWRIARSARIVSGFYISEALEVARS